MFESSFGNLNYWTNSSFSSSDLEKFETAKKEICSKYSALGSTNTLELLYFVSKYYYHSSYQELEKEYYKHLDHYTGEELLLFFDFLSDVDSIPSIYSVTDYPKKNQVAYQGVVKRDFAGYFSNDFSYYRDSWLEDTKRKINEKYKQKLEPIYAKQREEKKAKGELVNSLREKIEKYNEALEVWRNRSKLSKKIVKRPLPISFGLTDEDLELAGYNSYDSKSVRYREYLRALDSWKSYKGLKKSTSSYPIREDFDIAYSDEQEITGSRRR